MKNLLIKIGKKSRKAFSHQIDSKKKNKVLKDYHKHIKKNKNLIFSENKKDIKNAYKKKLKNNLIKRLILDDKKISDIINSIKKIIQLKDPTNIVLEKWKRPNGLNISKVSIPIGVIGVIYESRPNVTSDVASLCFKSGNSVILKGGSEAFYSNLILSKLFRKSLRENKVDENFVQFIDKKKRKIVDLLLTKMNNFIDVIIPRGGKGLIKAINENSSIPVIKHLDGICHIFVEKDANLEKAKAIILNSKMRRPGICGAVESLLINESLYEQTLEILKPLINAGCEIRGDKLICKLSPEFKLADNNDWSTEYLEKIISVKLVKNVDEAINHINTYSSGHTESIITEDIEKFNNFYKRINSAIILQNASTQFADGGEFGFGGEIGISTDKLHVRGPVGVEHLTSFKYVVQGNGQVRS